MPRSLLHEVSTGPLTLKGDVWEAVFITPGKGTSGTYGEDMLQNFVGEAFPVGTKHYFMHPSESKPERDPRDQWGVTVEAPTYREGVGSVGKIKILSHWKEVVESLAEAGQAELSIWAMGESDTEGNVIALYPDTQNAVDLVGYPGRPGSKLTNKMLESARAASPKPDVTSAQENHQEEGHMDKEIKALLEALIAKFDTFVTESKAATQGAVQAEADADAIEKAKKEAVASYDEKVAAIDAVEGLLPSQVKSLRESAKAGADVAPLIESAKAIVAEFEAKQSEGGATSVGRLVVSASATGDDYTVAGWN